MNSEEKNRLQLKVRSKYCRAGARHAGAPSAVQLLLLLQQEEFKVMVQGTEVSCTVMSYSNCSPSESNNFGTT